MQYTVWCFTRSNRNRNTSSSSSCFWCYCFAHCFAHLFCSDFIMFSIRSALFSFEFCVKNFQAKLITVIKIEEFTANAVHSRQSRQFAWQFVLAATATGGGGSLVDCVQSPLGYSKRKWQTCVYVNFTFSMRFMHFGPGNSCVTVPWYRHLINRRQSIWNIYSSYFWFFH